MPWCQTAGKGMTGSAAALRASTCSATPRTTTSSTNRARPVRRSGAAVPGRAGCGLQLVWKIRLCNRCDSSVAIAPMDTAHLTRQPSVRRRRNGGTTFNLRGCGEGEMMRTSTFLSPDELADLTDTPVKALQCSWLDQKGWIYTLSRMGNPKVLRSYAEQKLGMASAHPGDSEPDFTAWTTA